MIRLACLCASSSVLAACAVTPAVVQEPESYPLVHQSFDLKVGWRLTPTGQGMELQGVVQNVRYPQIRDLDITVSLLAPDRKVLSRGRSFTSPVLVNDRDSGAFSVKLPNIDTNKGKLLQFIIRYTAVEDAETSFSWMNSFVVDAVTGEAIQDNF